MTCTVLRYFTQSHFSSSSSSSSGRSGLAVTCLTAVWEDPGSNLTSGSCVHHDSHCDTQPWAWAANPYCRAYRSTQPSTLHGTVKWVSAFGLSNNKWRWWMRMITAFSGGLIVQVDRLDLGLADIWSAFIKWTGWTLPMACHEGTTINIISVIVIIIIIIIIIITLAAPAGIYRYILNVQQAMSALCST